MSLIDSVLRINRRYSRSFVRSVTHSAETLFTIVNESIQGAGNSNVLEEKKLKLDYAMAKLVELIKLANEYSFLDFRKISSIYDSIREVRNEIKALEVALVTSPPVENIAETGTGEPINTSSYSAARQESDCPYCGYHFPVMPQRRSSCPSCNKIIFVWYSTTENLKKLITREEATRIEKENSEHIEKYELVNKCETLEKSEAEIIKVQEGLQEKDPKATLDDAYLFLLNSKIKQSRKSVEKSSYHYLKALLLDSSGKDFFPDLYESRKLELQHLKSHAFLKKVQVISSPESCHTCKSDNDKVFTLTEALDKMPLPHKDCTRTFNGDQGFCRCTYLIVNE